MQKKNTFTKLLAIVGTLLVWFPIVMPIVAGFASLIEMGKFRLDYLMPAELFLFALAGGLLLIWVSIRARSHRGWIAGGLGAAIGLLLISQAVAVVTGLASGATEIGGWQWALVLVLFAIFIVALVVTAVGGILLLRDLFRLPASAGGA